MEQTPPEPARPTEPPPPDAPVLLEVEGVSVRYGNIEAIREVTLEVRAGEIVTLIGANGAGKTTTLRTVSGLKRAASGTVRFAGDDITQVPAHEIVVRGIGHAPEGRRIFGGLSVRENLEMGAFARGRASELAEDFDRVHSLFPILAERARQAAGTLSGGEQQMLAMGRALMGRPRLLMLDEPSMGLAPKVVQLIFEVIAQVNEQGTTVLLVEQNAAMALRLASRGYVLESGSVALSGSARSLLESEDVRKAYLGEE